MGVVVGEVLAELGEDLGFYLVRKPVDFNSAGEARVEGIVHEVGGSVLAALVNGCEEQDVVSNLDGAVDFLDFEFTLVVQEGHESVLGLDGLKSVEFVEDDDSVVMLHCFKKWRNAEDGGAGSAESADNFPLPDELLSLGDGAAFNLVAWARVRSCELFCVSCLAAACGSGEEDVGCDSKFGQAFLGLRVWADVVGVDCRDAHVWCIPRVL